MYMSQLTAICLTVDSLYPNGTESAKYEVVGRVITRISEAQCADYDIIVKAIFCELPTEAKTQLVRVKRYFDYNSKKD
jgi:hypothetical protein